MARPVLIKAIDAATATTTSEVILLEGATRAVWAFTRANHSSGSTSFAVEVSVDGETFVTYNKLISNVTNTNAQMLTRVAAVSLSSNTTSIVTMNLQEDCFKAMRVTATETTDGTHTAKVLVEYAY